MQEIAIDEQGNHLCSHFTDYLLPTFPRDPQPADRPQRNPKSPPPHLSRGVGESPAVSSLAAFVNSVVHALAHPSVRHIDMPFTREKVWRILRQAGVDSLLVRLIVYS